MITTNTYNMNDRVYLVRRINDIKNRKCYIDIFKLLHKKNINYTRNKNGIFFNVALLSDEVMSKICFILSSYELKKEKVYNNNIY